MTRRFLAAVAAFFFCLPAFADSADRSSFNAFMDLATGAGRHTVGFGSGASGQPLVTKPVAGSKALGNMGFSKGAGGWPSASGLFDLPSPIPGQPMPSKATQKFTKASTAKALARFAKFGGPLSAGMAIYGVLDELGYICDWNPTLSMNTCSKLVETGPPNGFIYKTVLNPSGVWDLSSSATCQRALGIFNSGSPKFRYTLQWENASTCHYTYTNSDYPNQVPYSSQTLSISGQQCPPHLPMPTESGCKAAGPGGTEYPAEWEEIEGKIASNPDWDSDTAVDEALRDAVASGESLETDGPLTVEPVEPYVQGSTSTVTNSDGSTLTTEKKCTYLPVSTGTIEYNCTTTTTTTTPQKTETKTEIKTNPDGTTSTQTVTTITPPKTETTTQTEDKPADMLCGVPGTPPCNVKVDETGTAKTVPELEDPEALARSPLTPYEQLKNSPSGFWPSLPTINWTFSLPTGCGVISVPGFAPFLESIDICPWQSLFHEIMTVVWVLGGLFGAISTFWRNTFATV